MKKALTTLLPLLLFLLAGVALGVAGTLIFRQSASLPDAPEISAASPSSLPVPSVPAAAVPSDVPALLPEATYTPPAAADGDLQVSAARSAYSDGGLQLIIPKLGVNVPVLNGVDAQTLLEGVGLYDYAQLPSEPASNVSIAGHRNGLRGGQITDDMPFYYLNTLTEGDYLYLADSTSIYQYQWELTWVIAPDNWDPIRAQGYSCLTLTTCTPIGIADHRLVVRGCLVQTLSYDSSYSYPSNVNEEVASA